MGLSARRQKQRIPKDPRNLGWAGDAARFGQNYLAKLGWDPSKGLGISGDGRTDHVKVSQKLDTLGIGVTKERELDSTAWRQNKDFEDVLKRLNETAASGEPEEQNRTTREREAGTDSEGRTKKKKRRMTKDPENLESKKGKRDDSLENPSSTAARLPSAKTLPHRAYRARTIASKSLASTSTVALSEILGVVPSSSAPIPPSTTISSNSLLEITTSTQSVADYFQAKLAAKTPVKVTSVS